MADVLISALQQQTTAPTTTAELVGNVAGTTKRIPIARVQEAMDAPSRAQMRAEMAAALTAGGVAGIEVIYDPDTDTYEFAARVEFYAALMPTATTPADETTTITAGTSRYVLRAPYNFEVTEIRAGLTAASSSGVVTVNVKANGVSIFSTKLTIDASEKTSMSAAVPAVVANALILNDAEIAFDIDTAGTGAKGLKVWLVGRRLVAVPPAAPSFSTGPTISGTAAPAGTLTETDTYAGDEPVTKTFRWRMRFT